MKLFKLTNRYYLLAFFGLLIINSFVLVILLDYFIDRHVDRSLERVMSNLVNIVQQSDTIPDFPSFPKNELEINEVGQEATGLPSFSRIMLYREREDQEIPYRQLVYFIAARSGNYEIILRKELANSNFLLQSILLTGLLTMLLSFLGLLVLNRWIIGRLWQPFYATLEKLKQFKIEKGNEGNFKQENIEEFNELNHELNLLTERVFKDYQGQKQFVENASHELQTPLAVIKSKLELLIQSERLGEEEMKLVASTLSSVGKLSKIIRSLILLSKIENRQFEEEVSIDLEQRCHEILEDFLEGIKAKNLRLHVEAHGEPVIKMSEMLADVMIANLIKNAVRHNLENGELNIKVEPKTLVIENTGKPLKVPVEELFKRFYSRSSSEESVGLGLAIIRQICKLYKFDLKYEYADSKHKVSIRF